MVDRRRMGTLVEAADLDEARFDYFGFVEGHLGRQYTEPIVARTPDGQMLDSSASCGSLVLADDLC